MNYYFIYPSIVLLLLNAGYGHSYDIDSFPNCNQVIGNEELTSNLCKNNAICKVRIHGEYIQTYCDCAKLSNSTHYFVGKYCEIAIPHPSISPKDINQTTNTCFLEDLLGINDWKNNFNIYSKLIR